VGSTALPLIALAAMALATSPATAQPSAPLALSATIEMPGVKGRIDHFAVDLNGRRLFVAALGNDTVEVLDAANNRHDRTLPGFKEPQGLAYVPPEKRLFVANGEGNRLDILDATSFAVLKRIANLEDADNVRYDAAAGIVIVGYGTGALRLLNAASAEPVADVRLAGHPESFQLERNGTRAFVNVPTAGQVAVVDRVKRSVVATWDVQRAGRNFPMALDEEGKRLYVGARSPAVMLVFDTDSGKVVARLSIGGDTDDLFFDAARKRVYVVCGEGRIDVYGQETPDRYVHQASIKTAPRARTGLFVPEFEKLFVAAPAAGALPARVLVYQVK
jgi:DNA-binding beta-propeller fold protein YncE